MTDQFHVAVLIGSLRANSKSSRIATAVREVAPKSLRLEPIAFGDLPVYNKDHDGQHAPESYSSFRAMITKAEEVISVTPEYNRSMPGGLKNAIDVGSRPYGWAPSMGTRSRH